MALVKKMNAKVENKLLRLTESNFLYLVIGQSMLMRVSWSLTMCLNKYSLKRWHMNQLIQGFTQRGYITFN